MTPQREALSESDGSRTGSHEPPIKKVKFQADSSPEMCATIMKTFQKWVESSFNCAPSQQPVVCSFIVQEKPNLLNWKKPDLIVRFLAFLNETKQESYDMAVCVRSEMEI